MNFNKDISKWVLKSIKISIRFLTNEIRSDALNIKIFTRKCKESLINCKYIDTNKSLVAELKKEILKIKINEDEKIIKNFVNDYEIPTTIQDKKSQNIQKCIVKKFSKIARSII